MKRRVTEANGMTPQKPTSHIRRAALIQEVWEGTDSVLGNRKLGFVHADTSMLLFDPNIPNPWFRDLAQVEWLLHNFDQINLQGGERRFLRRILLLHRRPALGIEVKHLYWATVKSLVHAHLYERVFLGLLLVKDPSEYLSFNFSYADAGKKQHGWGIFGFYLNNWGKRRKVASERDDVLYIAHMLNRVERSVHWLAPYRDEHFQAGARSSIAKSWRWFLTALYEGRCANCGERDMKGHIDHARPLTPDKGDVTSFSAGNAVIPNLVYLCGPCNQGKKNRRPHIFPEFYVPTIIPDPLRVRPKTPHDGSS
jgi:5-methylcytosine-specific restriction endonuclease McrA